MFKNLIQNKNEIMLQNTVINDSVLTWGEWQGHVINLVLEKHTHNIAGPFIFPHMPTGFSKFSKRQMTLHSSFIFKPLQGQESKQNICSLN